MSNPLKYFRRSLSSKLSMGILTLVAIGYIGALSYLFHKSRQIVKHEAIAHAERILDNTLLEVTSSMNEVETASQNMEWMILRNLQPDSLLNFTNRMLALNPHFNGCSITMEPDFFPKYGRYFSAYSVRKGDTISTMREGEYEYFEKSWYKAPVTAQGPIWVDPYDDYNSGTLYSEDMIISYSIPLYSEKHQLLGVLATDLSLPWLSKTLSAEKPYKNAYCMMVGKKGNYYVHPDSTRLINQTIFSGIDPNQHPDIITLGYEMTTGKQGILEVNIDGEDCFVCYRSVPQTDWSIALVCPESDILYNYNRLTYVIIPLIIIGLIAMFLFCAKAVKYFTKPLRLLAQYANHIVYRNTYDDIPVSGRTDVVGRLQNNFNKMQQSLRRHFNHLHNVNEVTEQRNAQLVKANQEALEADRRKTAFLQDVTHQIRTPLNIIMGFVQVLRDDYQMLPPEEIDSFTDTMRQNANAVTRMVDMLVAASSLNVNGTIEKNDELNCNRFILTIAESCFSRSPNTNVRLTTFADTPEHVVLHTNQELLTKVLNELLYNAMKFSSKQSEGGKIMLKIQCEEQQMRFIIEDNGPGIDEKDHERIFMHFTKLDDFNEGLGLGLAIARQYAHLLGGSLALDASYTAGARFILTLPIA